MLRSECRINPRDNLISYLAEPGSDFLIGTDEGRRIRKTLVNDFLCAREKRAGFICRVTHRDDGFYPRSIELIDEFRPVLRDIDAARLHVPFRNLGTGRVVSADEQYLLFHENTCFFHRSDGSHVPSFFPPYHLS